MPRCARTVVPGVPHHVTQRGNDRQDVFFSEDDRSEWLGLLHRQAARFGLRVLGYCLMTNHIHLIAVPGSETALARAVGRVNFLHAQRINRLHRRSGHLWQNRFYSCPLDPAATHNALAYVELNPVRAGMTARAWDYPWSSAAAHCGLAEPHPVLDPAAWENPVPPEEWRATLEACLHDNPGYQALRAATSTGRPLGSETFLESIENTLKKRVRPLPIGRQKGWRKHPEGAQAP